MTDQQLLELAIRFRERPVKPPATPKKLTLEQRKQAIRDAM
jgi:hypothetical protein